MDNAPARREPKGIDGKARTLEGAAGSNADLAKEEELLPPEGDARSGNLPGDVADPRSGPADEAVAAGRGQLELDPPQLDCLPPEDDIVDTALGAANLGTFSVSCVRCHGPSRNAGGIAATPAFEGLGDLVARGLLDPCNPDASPIVTSMREGRMPPPEDTFFTDGDRQRIEDGIAYMCELPTSLVARPQFCRDVPFYPECGVVNVETLLSRDCGHCHGESAADGDRVPLGNADVGDLASLIEAGYIVPCDSQASPLLKALRAGSAAPHNTCVRFPEPFELREIEELVDGLCEVNP